jgi:hypothetical protein
MKPDTIENRGKTAADHLARTWMISSAITATNSVTMPDTAICPRI